jgi:glycosyltransferase involved in cell wall biosynthesis
MSIRAPRYFLQEHLVTGAVFHGGIGNKDIETVLLRAGYLPVHSGDQENFGLMAKWRRFRSVFRQLRKLPQGADLVFQWPVYAKLHQLLIWALRLFRKDVRLICFLTDINGLKDADPELLNEELALFKGFEHFIVHNDTMAAWIAREVPGADIAEIEFFDFLAQVASSERHLSNEICFAGNLSKSRFLRGLEAFPELEFFLYGEPFASFAAAKHIHFEGQHKPGLLPTLVKGSFGLVWDGDSAEAMTGPLGTYAHWISPHKLSLYILAGMPVICAAGTAAAKLAEKYGIGICVDSMTGIADKISACTEGEYQAMRKKMEPLAARISTGQCLLDALAELNR